MCVCPVPSTFDRPQKGSDSKQRKWGLWVSIRLHVRLRLGRFHRLLGLARKPPCPEGCGGTYRESGSWS